MQAAALLCVDEMLEWMHAGHGDSSQIAIMDATNSTKRRRRAVRERVAEAGAGLIFVETICDDPDILEENIAAKIRSSPDFIGAANREQAMADMRERIANYEQAYEPIDSTEDSYSYIKLWNLQSKVLCNKCFGRIAKILVPFLMSTHVGPRPIWVVRCGDYDAESGSLSEEGRRFADALAAFVTQRIATMTAEKVQQEQQDAGAAVSPNGIDINSESALMHRVGSFDRSGVEVEAGSTATRHHYQHDIKDKGDGIQTVFGSFGELLLASSPDVDRWHSMGGFGGQARKSAAGLVDINMPPVARSGPSAIGVGTGQVKDSDGRLLESSAVKVMTSAMARAWDTVSKVCEGKRYDVWLFRQSS
eukprot:SAG31_NODE_2246_length_6099_cov_9.400333_3_plen_362_part_00